MKIMTNIDFKIIALKPFGTKDISYLKILKNDNTLFRFIVDPSPFVGIIPKL